jgi:hypothetical protein
MEEMVVLHTVTFKKLLTGHCLFQLYSWDSYIVISN